MCVDLKQESDFNEAVAFLIVLLAAYCTRVNNFHSLQVGHATGTRTLIRNPIN